MTKIIERGQGTGYSAYVAAFVLDEAGIAAASGSSFSPSWSTSTTRAPGYSSVFLTSVNQSALIGASAVNGANSQATVSTSPLATAVGDLVIVAATCGNTGTYSVNNAFIEAIELSLSSSDGVAGYKSAAGANETPSVTHSNANRQAVIGFVVQAGSSSIAKQAGAEETALVPSEFQLFQNYPNPFNPETAIRFALPNAETVTLEIYNAVGQLIRTLVEDETLAAGIHTRRWDGRDQSGRPVPSGLYMVRLTAGQFHAVQKAMLVK
jgi:hypothetical protein